MDQSRTVYRRIKSQKGITILEILLYIGLFSIISTLLIHFYISVMVSTSRIQSNLQKSEIGMYIRSLVEFQLQVHQPNDDSLYNNLTYTWPNADIVFLENAIRRIIKFYPNLELSDLQVVYHVSNGNIPLIHATTHTHHL